MFQFFYLNLQGILQFFQNYKDSPKKEGVLNKCLLWFPKNSFRFFFVRSEIWWEIFLRIPLEIHPGFYPRIFSENSSVIPTNTIEEFLQEFPRHFCVPFLQTCFKSFLQKFFYVFPQKSFQKLPLSVFQGSSNSFSWFFFLGIMEVDEEFLQVTFETFIQ